MYKELFIPADIYLFKVNNRNLEQNSNYFIVLEATI